MATTEDLPILNGSTPSAAVDASPASVFSHASYPPIERFQTIDGLLKSHAAERDQKPLIAYPKSGVDDFDEHTAADLDRYTDAAVHFYTQHGLGPAVGNSIKDPSELS
jgi:hypothetical protein